MNLPPARATSPGADPAGPGPSQIARGGPATRRAPASNAPPSIGGGMKPSGLCKRQFGRRSGGRRVVQGAVPAPPLGVASFARGSSDGFEWRGGIGGRSGARSPGGRAILSAGRGGGAGGGRIRIELTGLVAGCATGRPSHHAGRMSHPALQRRPSFFSKAFQIILISARASSTIARAASSEHTLEKNPTLRCMNPSKQPFQGHPGRTKSPVRDSRTPRTHL